MKKLVKNLFCLLLIVIMILNLFACNNSSKKGSDSLKENKGKIIGPLYTEMDMTNLPDGIYNVTFKGNDVVNKDETVMLNCTIFSEDIYDTVDIHQMKVGDTFVQRGEPTKIEKLLWDEKQSVCCINFDNWDDAIETINPSDSGGTYYISGADDHHSYTERGKSNIKVANTCLLTDLKELDTVKNANGAENVEKYIKENSPDEFWFLNTNITVENGEIIEITRWYIP